VRPARQVVGREGGRNTLASHGRHDWGCAVRVPAVLRRGFLPAGKLRRERERCVREGRGVREKGGRERRGSRACNTSQHTHLECSNHFSISAFSYVKPSAATTGLRMSVCEIGQVKSLGTRLSALPANTHTYTYSGRQTDRHIHRHKLSMSLHLSLALSLSRSLSLSHTLLT